MTTFTLILLILSIEVTILVVGLAVAFVLRRTSQKRESDLKSVTALLRQIDREGKHAHHSRYPSCNGVEGPAWMRIALPNARRLALIRAGVASKDALSVAVRRMDQEDLNVLSALRLISAVPSPPELTVFRARLARTVRAGSFPQV